ncbi:extensin-like [Gossypium raimondii]|uniref:extensin-like n=1 Tax=Gossypium raimondii TaxID=29730 RepID=UPI00063B002F|nr:extensin-like [Gossypium raimondii]
MDIVVMEVKIRSFSQYGGKYGVGTTSGYFCDRSEFDENMFPEPKRDKSEPRAPSKGKGKKHTSVGSSSGRRSSSCNLGYSDSSTSTQGFYPPEQPSYFQPSHGYPQPYGYYPPFPNYDVPYQPQMHPPPPMYRPPPPFMHPTPQLYEN